MFTHSLWNRHFLNTLNSTHLHRKRAFLGKILPLNCTSKVDSFTFSLSFSTNLYTNEVGQRFGSRLLSVCHRLFGQPQGKHLHTLRPLGLRRSVILDNIRSSCIASYHYQRWFTTSSFLLERLKPEDVRKRVENLTECFVEARELLGDARESVGSTYFSEDMMEAQEALSTTVAKYEALLAELEEDQRNDVIRTVGLRMEELKAQEQAIKDLLD